MKLPPTNPVSAKAWVQRAVKEERFLVAPVHFPQRLRERNETMNSVLTAILRAEKVEPYPGMPEHGGTCWRVVGMGTNGKLLGIGAELFLDENNEWVVLCTVIDLVKKKGRGR